MKQLLTTFLACITVLAIFSCEPEEQQFTFDPEVKLRFSADTVIFDTVFTTIGSTSRRLTVFNDDPNAVSISSIRTRNVDSEFNLTVNGVSGNDFEDIRLLGNDSMLLIVDVLIDPMDEDLPFVVEDLIEFETNKNLQSVNLVAWGQDAIFLNDSILSCEAVFSNQRPYVIYNSILVDSLCTLTIDPGARIFSHFGSSIFVRGSIVVNGDPDNRVIFSNDRFEDRFRNAPGQWRGIFFLEGSKENQISYANIRNADYGIWLGTPDNDTIPDLTLEGVVIENMSSTGLIAFTSDLVAQNTLIDNCAEYCVGNFAGGNYSYRHCTFANYSFTFFRENPLFAVADNLILGDGNVLIDDVKIELVNSIVWGDFTDELIFNNEGGADFSALIASNILKTSDASLDLNDNILNQDPLFISPEDYNYRLDSLSPAINTGLQPGLPEDLDGNDRDAEPDRGAFEWVERSN